jgi:hypothetical protein
MVKEVSQRSALSGRLSVLDSAPISRSRDIGTATGRRQVYLDWERWAGSTAFWNTLAPTHEGYLDLPAHRGHTKIESTVRYLGVEVDDALAIAEQVDV